MLIALPPLICAAWWDKDEMALRIKCASTYFEKIDLGRSNWLKMYSVIDMPWPFSFLAAPTHICSDTCKIICGPSLLYCSHDCGELLTRSRVQSKLHQRNRSVFHSRYLPRSSGFGRRRWQAFFSGTTNAQFQIWLRVVADFPPACQWYLQFGTLWRFLYIWILYRIYHE